MNPNTIAAVVAAVGAIAAAIAAFVSLPFAARAAKAAKSQTVLQAEIAREQSQPYVWADIQPDMKQGTVVQIVVANAGPTVATDVRVTIDPPFTPVENYPAKTVPAQARLAAGISSLAPGRRIEWAVGLPVDVIDADPRPRTLRITGNGPHGALTPLELQVNLSDWRESRDAPDGSLHLVRGAVQDLTKELKVLHQTLRSNEERALN